jgi:hypothetical protein
MIYSPAFAALPNDVRVAIYRRINDVLSGRDTRAQYARVTNDDRRAVLEILQDTLPDWRDGSRSPAARLDHPLPNH